MSATYPRIVLRERSAWEAVDLGLVLARKILPWSMVISLSFTLPLTMVLIAIHPSLSWLALALVWWTKPLFGRVALVFLEGWIFPNNNPHHGLVHLLQRACRHGLWRDLSYRRLSPWNYLLLPMRVLERQGHAALHGRWRQFARGKKGFSAGVTLCCFLFELSLLAGAIVFHSLLTTQHISLVPTALLSHPPEVHATWLAIIYCAVAAAAQPFVVGANLGLYINQRVSAEAWDIELALRRMAKRLQMYSVVLAMGFVCSSQNARAAVYEDADITSAEHSKQEIAASLAEVFATPEFATWESKKTWQRASVTGTHEMPHAYEQHANRSAPRWLTEFIGHMARLASWVVLLACASVVALGVRRRGLGMMPKAPLLAAASNAPTLEHKQRSEGHSDPRDWVDESLAAWQKRRFKCATGILYEGAVIYLRDMLNIPIASSWTEFECLHALEGLSTETDDSTQPLHVKFSDLVTLHTTCLYADSVPSDTEFMAVLKAWHQLLDEAR